MYYKVYENFGTTLKWYNVIQVNPKNPYASNYGLNEKDNAYFIIGGDNHTERFKGEIKVFSIF